VVDLINVDLIVDLEKGEMDKNRDQEDWIKGIKNFTLNNTPVTTQRARCLLNTYHSYRFFIKNNILLV
jgi:hypothetical protein